jgi:uncharacterized protein
MELNLQKLFNQPRNITVAITERLPDHIPNSCELNCDLDVEPASNYDLITMHTKGDFKVICQRCLNDFQYTYQHQTQLAVCKNDADAEKLMPNFDCIVAQDSVINLTDILTDDLHLFVPVFHANMNECHQEHFSSK